MKSFVKALEGVKSVDSNAPFVGEVTAYFASELPKLKDGDFKRASTSHARGFENVSSIMRQAKRSKGLDLGIISDYHLAQFYDSQAQNLDVMAAARDWKDEAFLIAKFAEQLEDSDDVIMDAGVGTGIELNALAHLFPRKHFIGYDISRRVIEIASDRTLRNGHKNIELYVGIHDALARGIKPGSVDVSYIKFLRSRDTLGAADPSGYPAISSAVKSGGYFVLLNKDTEHFKMPELKGFAPKKIAKVSLPDFYLVEESQKLAA